MKNLLYGATLVLLFFASVAAIVALLLNKEKAEEDALMKNEAATGLNSSELVGQCRVSFGVNGGRLVLLSSAKVRDQTTSERIMPTRENLDLTIFARLLDESGRELIKVPVKSEEALILANPETELKALPPKLTFSLLIPNLRQSNELELFYVRGPSGMKSLGRFALPLPE